MVRVSLSAALILGLVQPAVACVEGLYELTPNLLAISDVAFLGKVVALRDYKGELHHEMPDAWPPCEEEDGVQCLFYDAIFDVEEPIRGIEKGEYARAQVRADNSHCNQVFELGVRYMVVEHYMIRAWVVKPGVTASEAIRAWRPASTEAGQ